MRRADPSVDRRGPAVLALALAVLGAQAACSVFFAKETLYLRSAVHRATREEVRERLGPPTVIARSAEGEPLWVYHVYEIEPGGQNSWYAYGSWCDEYVLSFDGQGVLRRWTHRSEKHGGELMPTYCVTGGYKREGRPAVRLRDGGVGTVAAHCLSWPW